MRKKISLILLCIILSLLLLVPAFAQEDHNNNNVNDKFGLAVARLLAWTMEWRQRPGDFGGLYLHSSWGNIGVLEKRYQGVTVSNYYSLIPAFQKLYQKTGNNKYRQEILAMVDNLERLQMADGCFDHSAYEYEPGKGTVITNALADLGLLYEVEYTDDMALKKRIFKIVKSNFDWFGRYWWHWGNVWKKDVDYPAWCAVTNQDLSVAFAMLRYGQLSGDMSYFEHYGKPVTLWIMKNAYHPDLSMFDRGDRADFLEQVDYCGIIDRFLLGINDQLKDDRITKAVVDNLDKILENTWRDKYGHLRLPGAFKLNGEVERSPSDVLSIVAFIQSFDILKKQYRMNQYEKVKQELLGTLLFYQEEFGGIRGDVQRGDIIDLVPKGMYVLPLFVSYWQGSKLPEVKRPDLNLVISKNNLWIEDSKTWLIRSNKKIYSGVKVLPNGIYRDNRVKGLEKVLVEKGKVKVVLNRDFTGNWVSVELVGEGLRSVSVKGIERNIKVTCKGGKVL